MVENFNVTAGILKSLGFIDDLQVFELKWIP